MAKNEGKEKGGLCCSHCADSKYPCVTMEKLMRRNGEAEARKEENGSG